MRNIFERVPFRFINYIYWFLLLYLLAALAWWYIELVQQNELMYSMQKTQILQSADSSEINALNKIEDERVRNGKQYVGETGDTIMTEEEKVSNVESLQETLS